MGGRSHRNKLFVPSPSQGNDVSGNRELTDLHKTQLEINFSHLTLMITSSSHDIIGMLVLESQKLIGMTYVNTEHGFQ